MFDRFTEDARRALALARKEALGLKHDYIGTAHVLLGLVNACPAEILPLVDAAPSDRKAMLERFREKLLPPGPGAVGSAALPFTAGAKQALECSAEAVSVLRHQAIKPFHLLLGLALETHGRAAAILREQGATVEKIALRLLEAKDAPPDGERVLQNLREISTGSRVLEDNAGPWPRVLSVPRKQSLLGWLAYVVLLATAAGNALAYLLSPSEHAWKYIALTNVIVLSCTAALVPKTTALPDIERQQR